MARIKPSRMWLVIAVTLVVLAGAAVAAISLEWVTF
jgi:hypothetical protein